VRIRSFPAIAAALALTALACGGTPATQPPAASAPTVSEAPDTSLPPESTAPASDAPASDAPASDAPASDAPASDEPGSGSTSVAIIDNDFTPASVEVPLGGEVMWTSNGQNPHTVTFDDDGPDSGTLATGDTFRATFDEAGEFSYHCEIHSSMTGTVTVSE